MTAGIRRLQIGDRTITDEADCFVIAEIGHNHQGSVAQCKEMITIAKTCGVDAVKLDCYLREIAKPTATGLINKLTGRPLRAVIVMHAFGHPADLDALCLRFSEALSHFGYPPCPGQIMVSNPMWRQSAAQFGQMVQQRKVAGGTNTLSLDVHALQAGDYTVDIQMADGSRQNAKLIIKK